MNQERLKARDEAAEEYAKLNEIGGAPPYDKHIQYVAFKRGWDAAVAALAEKEIERLREALKQYSSDSMRIGSTITPKWADEALGEEKVSTKPDLPFPGQRYCPHGQDEYYCFECHPYGAYAKKEKK